MKIAVLVPCYNEATTIGTVIVDFRAALPEAEIFVYDNNSSDGTPEAARGAGGIVRLEPLQGKGHVVRRMFADIEADVYVLVDGDATYDAASAPVMVQKLLAERLDMVVGRRRHEADAAAYRAGHKFGNRALTWVVASTFGGAFADMLSGYRALSRRFVKSFPALASGFETETELTVHALSLHLPAAEVDTPYFARPKGSTSKLSTFRDGVRIVVTIIKFVKEERPLSFFASIGAALIAIALILGAPIFVTYAETGLVPRFPTAIAATGLTILGFLNFAVALIVDSVRFGRLEMRRLAYLRLPALGAETQERSRSREGAGRPHLTKKPSDSPHGHHDFAVDPIEELQVKPIKSEQRP
jgi:glycosyltransferase involved in cell wall biosynthesis